MVFQTFTVRIDQHKGQILNILDSFQRSQTDFIQRVESAAEAGRIRRSKTQNFMPLGFAPAGSERPILPLNVQGQGGAWPGQKRRQDQAHPLT